MVNNHSNLNIQAVLYNGENDENVETTVTGSLMWMELLPYYTVLTTRSNLDPVRRETGIFFYLLLYNSFEMRVQPMLDYDHFGNHV